MIGLTDALREKIEIIIDFEKTHGQIKGKEALGLIAKYNITDLTYMFNKIKEFNDNDQNNLKITNIAAQYLLQLPKEKFDICIQKLTNDKSLLECNKTPLFARKMNVLLLNSGEMRKSIQNVISKIKGKEIKYIGRKSNDGDSLSDNNIRDLNNLAKQAPDKFHEIFTAKDCMKIQAILIKKIMNNMLIASQDYVYLSSLAGDVISLTADTPVDGLLKNNDLPTEYQKKEIKPTMSDNTLVGSKRTRSEPDETKLEENLYKTSSQYVNPSQNNGNASDATIVVTNNLNNSSNKKRDDKYNTKQRPQR